MNVLFITHYEALYGANKSLLSLVKILKDNYNIKPIVLMPAEGQLLNTLQLLNIEYIIHKFYPWMAAENKKHFFMNKIKSIIKKILNHVYYFRIRFKIKRYKIDFIHTNSSLTQLGYQLSKDLNIPHIWHIREFGYEDYNLKYIYSQKYVNKCYENSSRIIAISEAIKNNMKSKFKNINIIRIYNGVEIKNQSKIFLKSVNEINFCCVGVIMPTKNQLEILKAICLINNSNNTCKFKVHFIGGGDKGYINLLDDFIKSNNIECFVNFWGYRDDVHEILPKMDVGILSSLNEAFGRVTVEYMLNSMPVIATNSGGTIEIIQDGVHGYLYNSGNEEELKECMLKFINNRFLCALMGKSAYDNAINNFTANINAELIYKLYCQLMNCEI